MYKILSHKGKKKQTRFILIKFWCNTIWTRRIHINYSVTQFYKPKPTL